ncbi:MAG: acyl carrier protein [Anaerolineaceae bacterium]|nr:acyl carrier protein [Anaerolineaceae bacterium]
MESIIEFLAQKIAAEILRQNNRTIKADEKLISSGLIDSFSLVDLALIVEDEYGVQLDDTELTADHFDTIQELAEIIVSRQV